MCCREVYELGVQGAKGVSSQISRDLNTEQRSVVCPGKGSEQESSTARLVCTKEEEGGSAGRVWGNQAESALVAGRWTWGAGVRTVSKTDKGQR